MSAPLQGPGSKASPKWIQKLDALFERFDGPEKDKSKPAPWPARWAGRLLVGALVVYSYYVFIGRICAPMLQRLDDARGGVGQGAGLLVGYHILFLMFCWTYLKCMLTEPGYALKVIPQSAPPPDLGKAAPGQPPYGHDNDPSAPVKPTGTEPYEQPSSSINRDIDGERGVAPGPLDGAANLLPISLAEPSGVMSHGIDTRGNGNDEWDSPHRFASPNEHETTAQSGDPETSRHSSDDHHTASHAGIPHDNKSWATPSSDFPDRPLRPVKTEPAYCRWCRIWKPPRCHHCSVCGQCVLGMDHDCPWIACIGWRNHKFFINFLMWSTLYCGYVSIVSIVKLAQGGSTDGQIIAMAVAGAFFSMFSIGMLFSHAGLVVYATSTIESYTLKSQLDHERDVLNMMYGGPLSAWGKKRRVMKHWRLEWGNLRTEGNRWYVGPRGVDQWKMVMSDSLVGWILPVKRSRGDGIHFDQNPRFAPDGSRMKRDQWPPELR